MMTKIFFNCQKFVKNFNIFIKIKKKVWIFKQENEKESMKITKIVGIMAQICLHEKNFISSDHCIKIVFN